MLMRFLAEGWLFQFLGLGLALAGAWIAARSVILTEDEALGAGLATFAHEAHMRAENLKLPGVANLLSQSKSARRGLTLVAVGAAFQGVGLIQQFIMATVSS